MRLALLICAVLAAASPSWASGSRWLGAWGASPTPPQVASPGVPERLLSPRFDNQTISQVVRLSAGGQRFRLRLTNEYGVRPLRVGALRVTLVDAEGSDVPETSRAVTFGGAFATSIPPGAPMLSDPVDLSTPRLARLRVSLYLPDQTGPCTCHMSGQEFVAVAGPGDLTAQTVPKPTGPAQFRAFLSGVEVEQAGQSRVIVNLGDSITDGYLSTPGADRRWPDRLAERLNERYPKKTFGVVNAGIGGNRVLSDAVVSVMGQSALTRFDRDVLSVAGATDVVVLEGVNDLGARVGRPSAEELIAGYRQLIARAHGHGLRIIGGTILPYDGAGYFTAEGEATRQTVNAWIRAPGNFDAVIDFDAAIREPAKPTRMRAEWHAGDWLHPNDAGYRAMGDAVDLALFR